MDVDWESFRNNSRHSWRSQIVTNQGLIWQVIILVFYYQRIKISKTSKGTADQGQFKKLQFKFKPWIDISVAIWEIWLLHHDKMPEKGLFNSKRNLRYLIGFVSRLWNKRHPVIVSTTSTGNYSIKPFLWYLFIVPLFFQRRSGKAREIWNAPNSFWVKEIK